MRTHSILMLLCTMLLSCAAWADDQPIRIVAPAAEETIHDNNGAVAVDVAVSGPVGGGSVVSLLMDGAVVASGTRLHFDLTDVDRGEHVLVAQVRAADGTVLAASEPVTFYMWRASVLFPGRR